MKRKTLITGNIILLIMAVIWVTQDDSMEPKIAVGGLVLALLGLIFFYGKEENESESKPANMAQKAGKNSKQYQSGGDMTINEK